MSDETSQQPRGSTPGHSGNITTGNISGSKGIAIGHGAKAIVKEAITNNQESKDTILALVAQLMEQVKAADIKPEVKTAIEMTVVPEIEEAAEQVGNKEDPTPKLERAIGTLDTVLKRAGTAADKVAPIIETVKKIAGVVGLVGKTVAPFLLG